METSGNTERDVAVMAVQIQVLTRDLERVREDLGDYRDVNDKAVRDIQNQIRWVLGAATALGGILTVGGSAIVRFLAGLIAKG